MKLPNCQTDGFQIILHCTAGNDSVVTVWDCNVSAKGAPKSVASLNCHRSGIFSLHVSLGNRVLKVWGLERALRGELDLQCDQ